MLNWAIMLLALVFYSYSQIGYPYIQFEPLQFCTTVVMNHFIV